MEDRSQELTTADLAEPSGQAERSEAEDEIQLESREDDHVRSGDGSRDETDPTVDEAQPLLPREEAEGFRQRWEAVQTEFVDHPQGSVEAADNLVAEALRRVAETFSAERETLEDQWGRGEDVSTEDLRVILQRYRSFFNRLLAA